MDRLEKDADKRSLSVPPRKKKKGATYGASSGKSDSSGGGASRVKPNVYRRGHRGIDDDACSQLSSMSSDSRVSAYSAASRASTRSQASTATAVSGMSHGVRHPVYESPNRDSQCASLHALRGLRDTDKSVAPSMIPVPIPRNVVVVARLKPFGSQLLTKEMVPYESLDTVFADYAGHYMEHDREPRNGYLYSTVPGHDASKVFFILSFHVPVGWGDAVDDGLSKGGGGSINRFGALSSMIKEEDAALAISSFRPKLINPLASLFSDRYAAGTAGGVMTRTDHDDGGDEYEGMSSVSDGTAVRNGVHGDDGGESGSDSSADYEPAKTWHEWMLPENIFRIIGCANETVRRFVKAGRTADLNKYSEKVFTVMSGTLEKERPDIDSSLRRELAKRAAAMVKRGVSGRTMHAFSKMSHTPLGKISRTGKDWEGEVITELRRRFLYGIIADDGRVIEGAASDETRDELVEINEGWQEEGGWTPKPPDVSVFVTSDTQPTAREIAAGWREKRVMIVFENYVVRLEALIAMRAEFVARLSNLPPYFCAPSVHGFGWDDVVTSHYYSRTLGVPLPGSEEGETLCHICRGTGSIRDGVGCICVKNPPAEQKNGRGDRPVYTNVSHPAMRILYIARGWHDDDDGKLFRYPNVSGSVALPTAVDDGDGSDDDDDDDDGDDDGHHTEDEGEGGEDENLTDVSVDDRRGRRGKVQAQQRKRSENERKRMAFDWSDYYPRLVMADIAKRGSVVVDQRMRVYVCIPRTYAPFRPFAPGKFEDSLQPRSIMGRMPALSSRNLTEMRKMVKAAALSEKPGMVSLIYNESTEQFQKLLEAVRSVHPMLAEVSMLMAARCSMMVDTTTATTTGSDSRPSSSAGNAPKKSFEGVIIDAEGGSKRERRQVFDVALTGIGSGYCPVLDPYEVDRSRGNADYDQSMAYWRIPDKFSKVLMSGDVGGIRQPNKEVLGFAMYNRLIITKNGVARVLCKRCRTSHVLGVVDGKHRSFISNLFITPQTRHTSTGEFTDYHRRLFDLIRFVGTSEWPEFFATTKGHVSVSAHARTLGKRQRFVEDLGEDSGDSVDVPVADDGAEF